MSADYEGGVPRESGKHGQDVITFGHPDTANRMSPDDRFRVSAPYRRGPSLWQSPTHAHRVDFRAHFARERDPRAGSRVPTPKQNAQASTQTSSGTIFILIALVGVGGIAWYFLYYKKHEKGKGERKEGEKREDERPRVKEVEEEPRETKA